MIKIERLEFIVEDAISRIKLAWKDSEGKMFVSFSGGDDSLVLYHLVKMAGIKAKNLFFDTGIELDSTYKFIKTFDDVEWLKPRKVFGRIIKEYGVPFKSKYLSEYLHTFDINQDNPFKLIRNNDLIKGTIHKIRDGGVIENTGQKITTGRALPKGMFHVLHPDRVNEYTIHNRCCSYLKKDPSIQYIKTHDVTGYFTGVRSAEGGVRKMAYKGCRNIKKVGKKQILQSMPMIDWMKEDVVDFLEYYQIERNEAYTVYGLERTGCFCCPFSQTMEENLKALHDYEPNKYKASLKWLGHVYMDMGVDLPFDPNYQEKKEEREKVNDERRKEMLIKYGRN